MLKYYFKFVKFRSYRELVIERCEEMLNELLQSNAEARAATKALLRAPTIDRFRAERERSIEEFVKVCSGERVQMGLALYIQSIKG
jgi:hypothetical protein